MEVRRQLIGTEFLITGTAAFVTPAFPVPFFPSTPVRVNCEAEGGLDGLGHSAAERAAKE
jgi:hypothetical protein